MLNVILWTHNGCEVHTFVGDEEFVSQPRVGGFSVEKPPVENNVPVCSNYASNYRGYPGYYIPLGAVVFAVRCPCNE